MAAIRIGIVGVGKIARDQHVPALRANAAFELVATASPHSRLEGVTSYPTIEAMLEAEPTIDAVALCTTPQVRYDAARYALGRGRHVLLEKPPGRTVSEVLALIELAKTQRVALQASWHSRHARGVEAARAWLAERLIRSATVTWKENVRVWHPGQSWIWQAGGLGVFDPGINALSILTRIVPGGIVLKQAELSWPSNCDTPIAAQLLFATTGNAPVQMQLDFLHPGEPSWNIEVDTDAGRLCLQRGGESAAVDGRALETVERREYPDLYALFAQLVRERRMDVDLAPLQLVADAFLCARRVAVEPFIE